MNFEDYLSKKGYKPEPSKEVPEQVTKTLTLANQLLEIDYYDVLMSNENLKKFVENENGMHLYKRGWRVQYGSSRQWAGLCSVSESSVAAAKNKNIYISIEYVKGDDFWSTKAEEVILHEISHAIVREIFYFGKHFSMCALNMIDPENFTSQGHGVIWQQVCRTIRNGQECPKFYALAGQNDLFKKYKYFCGDCGNEEYSDNKYFARRCSKCKNLITVVNN